MKTLFTILVILGIAVLAFSEVTPAYAAEALRGGPGNGGGGGGNSGGGNGHQGELGTGTGVPVQQNINLDGVLEDYLHASLAEALGITVEELSARLDAGETFSQIALELGFDLTVVNDMLTQARLDALTQAVADGLITQEQADWLASRGSQNPEMGAGDGTGLGNGMGIGDGTCDGDCIPDGTHQSMAKQSHQKGFRK